MERAIARSGIKTKDTHQIISYLACGRGFFVACGVKGSGVYSHEVVDNPIKRGYIHRMSVFVGQVINSIDGKNRLSIPSRYRKILNSDGHNDRDVQLLLSTKEGDHPYIAVYPQSVLDELADNAYHGSQSTKEDEIAFNNFLSSFTVLSLDGNGRITLPASLYNGAQLEGEALVIGKGKTFEIWNSSHHETWMQKQKVSDENFEDFERRLRRSKVKEQVS